MALPGFKSDDEQGSLWERPLTGHGSCRASLGDFAERLTARILHGRRYRTDSRCNYCPDVFALGAWFEVKTAGRNNESFVYQGRLEKDRRFAEQRQLYYVIWHHAADTKACLTHADLRRSFLMSLKAVYVLPFAEVDAVAQSVTVTKLNSKYGKSDTNPVYGAGYRLPIKMLKCRQCLTLSVERSSLLF